MKPHKLNHHLLWFSVSKRGQTTGRDRSSVLGASTSASSTSRWVHIPPAHW